MNAIGSFSVTLCYLCIGLTILSCILPQKRTRHILGFVIGLFILVTAGGALSSCIRDFRSSLPQIQHYDTPSYDEQAYVDTVAQMTADELVKVTDELLQNEGIVAKDIRLSLKITDEGRIFISRADIYISEMYADRLSDIERVVYENLSKEPDVYVTQQEPE